MWKFVPRKVKNVHKYKKQVGSREEFTSTWLKFLDNNFSSVFTDSSLVNHLKFNVQ